MNSIPANTTQTLSSVDASGRGSTSELKRADATAVAQNGLSTPGASLPGTATTGRRLQDCADVGLQFTQWLLSNPYAWANASLGLNSQIPGNATVSVLELSRCGVLVDFGSPVEVKVAMPEREAQVDETPTCTIFDAGGAVFVATRMVLGLGQWVRDNITLTSASRETMIATCETSSSGAYAIYYRPRTKE